MENSHVAVPAGHPYDTGLRAAELEEEQAQRQHHEHAGHGHGSEDHAVTSWAAMGRFGLHYVEMVVAMVVGMTVLGPVWAWGGSLLGWTSVLERPDVGSMVMAANMTVGMGAWMRIRGHGWRPVAEMGAAMVLPFVMLLFPLWMGVLGHGTLMSVGHLLMFLGMAVAMLLRPAEYIHHRHARKERVDGTRLPSGDCHHRVPR